MIINTGGRTDTVQYYTKWLLKRLDEGYVYSRNPLFPNKVTRKGCHCIESRDIGAYDTCLNRCKYCYANKTPQKAFENYKLHDPDSPLLLGHIKDSDIIQRGNQKSYLKAGEK